MKRIVVLFVAAILCLSSLLSSCKNASDISVLSDEESVSAAVEDSAVSDATDGENLSEVTSVPDEGSESAPDESSDTESKPEQKPEQKPETKPDDPSDTNPPEDAVKVLFARYTESRPTFVTFGKCAENATVTATLGGESITVESYMGYFAVSFTKSGSAFDITFSQTVDGKEYDIPRTYNVKPTVSSKSYEQTVIASNEKFQFFLSKMIPDFEGGNLYSQSAIDSMVSRVERRLDSIHQYNSEAEIIYMVIPSPMTIYPELVPDIYTQNKGETRMDQVLSALDESGATVIDVRDTFNAHKNDEMPLYYKMDSHWADYGAYLAYVELFDHIAEKYPDAAPRKMDDFIWEADYYRSADVIMYLDYPQYLVEEYGYYRQFGVDIPYEITTVPRYRLPQLLYSDDSTYENYFRTGRSNLPSCMVFRDSYGAGVYDLIPERMDTTHYVGMWNYSWNNNRIQSEKPDYIIYVVAEWNLHEIVYS